MPVTNKDNQSHNSAVLVTLKNKNTLKFPLLNGVHELSREIHILQ